MRHAVHLRTCESPSMQSACTCRVVHTQRFSAISTNLIVNNPNLYTGRCICKCSHSTRCRNGLLCRTQHTTDHCLMWVILMLSSPPGMQQFLNDIKADPSVAAWINPSSSRRSTQGGTSAYAGPAAPRQPRQPARKTVPPPAPRPALKPIVREYRRGVVGYVGPTPLSRLEWTLRLQLPGTDQAARFVCWG